MNKGGNKHRQINISSLLPEHLWHRYIYQYNNQYFGTKQLKFAKTSNIITTNNFNGKCPYKFASWFFNHSNSLRSESNRTPQEWIDIYNCNFQYSKYTNKVVFTADVSWCHDLQQDIWQKLNDTT